MSATQADYDAGHLQGARRISEEDVSRPHDMTKMASGDLMLELPPIDELRDRVASYGISDSSRIVVYFGKTAAVQSATRIVFTLDYLGLGDRDLAPERRHGGVDPRRSDRPSRRLPPVSRGTLTTPAGEERGGGRRLREVARGTARPSAGGRPRRGVLSRHRAEP